MTWRRGGGKELGVKGLEPDPRVWEQYVLRGAPACWGHAVVQRCLVGEKYEDIESLLPPRSKSQGCLFMVKAGVAEEVFSIGGEFA